MRAPASLPLGTLAAILVVWAGAARAVSPDAGVLLATPLDTSLAPPPTLPGGTPPLVSGGVIAGGEVITTFGSNGTHGAAVRLDSGLLGGTTRAYVAAGTEQGPRWHDRPELSGQGVSAGVETALPYGITVGVQAGYERDRLRPPGAAAAPPGP